MLAVNARHTICSQSGTLVGGDESADDGAVLDSSTDIPSKESATGADLKGEESSGKHLKSEIGRASCRERV